MNAIVVVDVEATCWPKNPPPGQQSEIIEIGVCLVDLTSLEIKDAQSILVKPARSQVSEFCTQLTTLTQADVDSGMSFHDACALLQEQYQTSERTWGSWGNYDRRMFEQQCASFYVDYPFGSTHINLKQLFTEKAGLHRQVGMARALDVAGLKLEGTHHRGGDDARNIARLLLYLLDKHGTDVLNPKS
jgi:inhibitor of KinA sporulation pathway (predicted exonuclease)